MKTPLQILVQISDLLDVIGVLGHLTIKCLNFQLEDSEDTWFLDTTDDLLLMWSLFVEKLSGIEPEEIKKFSEHQSFNQLVATLSTLCAEIVNVYIETHIHKFVPEEEDEDFELKDSEDYEEQLIHIAALARLKPQAVLERLSNVLSEKQKHLEAFFANCYEAESPTAIIIQEHMHWIILISGHVLADAGRGEVPLIPNSMLDLCVILCLK
jgi:hypothetical protein